MRPSFERSSARPALSSSRRSPTASTSSPDSSSSARRLSVWPKMPGGGVDVSPRGDPPAFVRILDDRTLLIPDRPGNRIADTLTNLIADPSIGLLFLIPGVGDSFRINGRGFITDDHELLAPSEVEGSVPRLGILVSIEEAYSQCSKALIRSDLWNPERHIERSALPSSGEILRSLNDPAFDATEYDEARAERYARREGL